MNPEKGSPHMEENIYKSYTSLGLYIQHTWRTPKTQRQNKGM
jgi:hypothetical protein